MENILWLLHHGQTFLDPIGIIGGLAFTGVSLRSETKARRVSNILAITAQHRDIWSALYERPALGLVTNAKVDMGKHPPTAAERLFVRFVILHVASVYRAVKADEMLEPDGTEDDVKDFFSLPIPEAIWQDLKSVQDRDFVEWVDGLR